MVSKVDYIEEKVSRLVTYIKDNRRPQNASSSLLGKGKIERET